MGLFDFFNTKTPQEHTPQEKAELGKPTMFDKDFLRMMRFAYSYGKLKNINHHDRIELKDIYYDPTVQSVTNTRLNGLCNYDIMYVSDDLNYIDEIRMQIDPIKDNVIRQAVWSIFLGFSIGENIWAEEDGRYRIKYFMNRDYVNFCPAMDGFNVMQQHKFNECHVFNTPEQDVYEPIGKYLLSVNEGCPENRYGQALYGCLLYLCKVREFGYRSWAKMLERFGNPFLHGRVDGGDQKVQNLMELLKDIMDGSSVATSKDVDIDILEPKNSNGQAFKVFEDCMRQQIHLAVLGQNLTTEVNSGSLAAAEVHNEIRKDKIKDDIRLAESALNRQLSFIKYWNQDDVDIKIRLVEKDGIEKERAERDSILVSAGVLNLTEQYILNKYDYDEGDFTIGSSPLVEQGLEFSKQPVDLNLNRQDPTDDLEDVVEILKEIDPELINREDIMTAVQASTNRQSLIEQLKSVASDYNGDAEDVLTTALYYALHRGVVEIGD